MQKGSIILVMPKNPLLCELVLTYVTSGKYKYDEAALILPHLQWLDADQLVHKEIGEQELPEPQSLDVMEVIRQKLAVVRARMPDAERIFIVDDSSSYFEGFGIHSRLPGPFLKHFSRELSSQQRYELAQLCGKWRGVQPGEERGSKISMIGLWCKETGEKYFSSQLFGRLVAPRIDCEHRYDAIFVPDGQPEGQEKTYAEMTAAEKNAVSHRGKALRKVAEYLKSIGWTFTQP